MTEAAAAAAPPAPSKGPPPPPASLGPPELQSLVSRLLKVGMQGGRLTTQVSEKELSMMCVAAYKLFARQPTCIEIDPPVVICGDIHGQYSDLLRIFDKSGFPPEQNYMFLGDYVDRGKQNLETVCLLFTYKLLYPENFFLLRGNHECHNVNRVYGFYEEINRRYKSPRLWQYFQKAFSVMPLTGLIGGRILCMHGGISPQMKSIEDLRAEYRPMETPPMPSMYIDILWADPDPKIQGWKANTRGVSYTFGEDIVGEMCKTLDIDLIARAHQVVQDGYEFLADRRLVTLFSAPHYCGQFDNHAATMLVGADLSCSFNTFRPLGKTARMLIAKELAKKEPMPADNAAPQCTAPGGPEENNSDRQRGTKLQHAPKEKKEEAAPAPAPTPPAESPAAAAAPPAETAAAPPAEAATPAPAQ